MFNDTSVYIQQCKIDKPVHQLCPISRMKTDERPRNAYLYGLFGLAGLAGLSGLALVKKKADCGAKHLECLVAGDRTAAEDECKSLYNGQFHTSYAGTCTNKCVMYPIPYQGACCYDVAVGGDEECDLQA